MMTYRIAVIEDDLYLRSSIREEFAKSARVEIEFESDSIERMLSFYQTRAAPHLILLDLSLPGLSGIDGLPLMRRKMPETEIVVHTFQDDDDKIFQAICNGASGYLLKNTPLAELEKYLLTTLEERGSVLSPSIARRVLGYFRPQNPALPQEEDLNETEKSIVNLLVDGLTYAEIASKIGLSIDGVRYYIKRIYSKLHIRTRSQLARRFLKK
ncbi:MAG TPA: response regulator transcription factor [Saprospiraceae bacterium]|nr:response regulator transcription factor [Saprospiraceae bacterium]